MHVSCKSGDEVVITRFNFAKSQVFPLALQMNQNIFLHTRNRSRTIAHQFLEENYLITMSDNYMFCTTHLTVKLNASLELILGATMVAIESNFVRNQVRYPWFPNNYDFFFLHT